MSSIVWGAVQLVTGATSDKWVRKRKVVNCSLSGRQSREAPHQRTGSGRGSTPPKATWPAMPAGAILGVYRVSPDGGFAVGALLTGVPAAVAALTAGSGIVVAISMRGNYYA
ncbi:hypothetical protein [Arthrobacter sp. STN4]|uniref:hypothetical protein n=1 Tax=Arthrobacter sp. STN4 TaxID=2923276 RepID=UPI002119FA14|nr:hypothetical protein [Arthrobacter sp. STN4]MCQ9165871.1 hypothetical protein [Arthrobacter sp. STN4]